MKVLLIEDDPTLQATLQRTLERRGMRVVTCGDGARALTSRLEAHAIRLTGEVAPGIPIGTLSGGPRHGLTIVTKAGGFGSPTALLDAAEAVRHTKGSNG